MLAVERIGKDRVYDCLLQSGRLGMEEWLTVQQHVERSEVFVGVCKHGTVQAVVGAVRVTALSDTGYLWMTSLRPLGVAFARASRQIRPIFFEDFDVLVGLSFDASSVRWLKWLGVDYGAQNADGAYPFVIRRADG